MIDLHITIHGKERLDWFEECLDSLSKEPVNIHFTQSIIGNLPQARWDGMQKGSAEWVGWVDADDLIIPGIYSKLLDNVGCHKFAYANEEVWVYEEDQQTITHKYTYTSPHHIHIIHRSVLEYGRIIQFKNNQSPDLWTHDFTASGVHLNEIGYIWRRCPNSMGIQMRKQSLASYREHQSRH